MGGLLALLKNEVPVGDNIFVDFENAKPTEEEKDWIAVNKTLEKTSQILQSLKSYTGQGAAISKAISNPVKENEDEAWRLVLPQVLILKQFYEYAGELENVLPVILEALCAGDPIRNLEVKQATTKQLADLLHFVLLFDDLKMTTPAIQNDFSFYRRCLNRMKLSDNSSALSDVIVRDEMANKMSLFYAYPVPMFNTIVSATTRFVTNLSSAISENVTLCFSTMVRVCHNAVNNPEFSSKYSNPETTVFCLRVMVGLIVLYDHIHPLGAFCKGAPIDIKSCIKIVQVHGGEHKDGLLNALRFSTKHLNDDETPRSYKQMLA